MTSGSSVGFGVLLAMTAMPELAWAATPASGDFGLSVGAEYSSGEYGGDRRIEDFYVPVTGWYRGDGYTIRLTVPYLSVTAPQGTLVQGPGGELIPGEGPDTTEQGLGDVILGLTVYDVWTAADGSLALDVGGKVKFGTADEDQFLGTGETDFTFQADLVKYWSGFTGLASAGYVVRGDPDQFDLDNGFVAALGGMFGPAAGTQFGAFIEYQQAAYRFNDDRMELAGVIGWRLGRGRVLLSTSAGLSDSAPDWTAGFTFYPGW